MAYGLFGGMFGRRRPQDIPDDVVPFTDQGIDPGATSKGPPLTMQPMGGGVPAGDKTPMAQQRRGMFSGLFGSRGSQRVANAAPSFWEWLTLGPEAPDILDQRRMRRELFDRGTREQKFEDRDREALEQAIGTLDPRLQPWARVAPEVAAREVLGGEGGAGRWMTPEEVAERHLPPGTVVWIAPDGTPHVMATPRAPRHGVQDNEPQLGPGDEWVN